MPRHHVRQAVELVLDVTKPLPTPKNLEVNLALIPPALDALYTQFELALVQFLFDLTASKDAVRYSDVGLLTALRLASFVHASVFLRDPAKQGPISRRVEEILDRFVVVLAGVAVVRYMQEFLGSAVDEWVRKSRPLDPSISSMWLAFKLMWSPGVESLARALVVGRADVSFLLNPVIMSSNVFHSAFCRSMGPVSFTASNYGHRPASSCKSCLVGDSPFRRASALSVWDEASVVHAFTRCLDCRVGLVAS